MGLRLIVLLVALWALISIARRVLNRRRRSKKLPHARPAVDTVSCAHCGLHLPQPEAISKDGRFYCCREHMRIGDGNA